MVEERHKGITCHLSIILENVYDTVDEFEAIRLAIKGVANIMSNSKIAKKFKTKSQEAKLPGTFIQSVQTRWLYENEAMNRVLALKGVILSLREDLNFPYDETDFPTERQFIIMEQLSPVLTLLKNFSDEIEATINLIIPRLMCIDEEIRTALDDKNITREVLKCLQLYLVNILDPYYRDVVIKKSPIILDIIEDFIIHSYDISE